MYRSKKTLKSTKQRSRFHERRTQFNIKIETEIKNLKSNEK